MKPEKLLKKGLADMGIRPGGEVIEAFMLYLSELKRWSAAYNLSGLKTEQDMVVRHFLDSALYLRASGPVLPEGARVADVGSGAGFPGLPVRLLRPDLSLTLIESNGKKAEFLRYVCFKLGLKDVVILNDRVSAIGPDLRFDCIMTRAAFSLREFSALCQRFLASEGKLIAGKGPAVREELSVFRGRYKLKEFKLPFSDSTRYFVIINKDEEQNRQ